MLQSVSCSLKVSLLSCFSHLSMLDSCAHVQESGRVPLPPLPRIVGILELDTQGLDLVSPDSFWVIGFDVI